MTQDTNQVLGPIATESLIGHAKAEYAFLETATAGRIPHAWLISGPLGIGKMTLACRIARFQLKHQSGDRLFNLPETMRMDSDDPLFRRILAGGHGDIKILERSLHERTKKQRSNIVVDQIRELSRFYTMTSAEGGWRIAIIDGAEQMNRNAANALLKLLEEPPKFSLLLLVCHSPGQLLPTIRSRCRRLLLQPLKESDAIAVMKEQAPTLDANETVSLVRLAEGSPGRALAISAAGGLEIYDELISMVKLLPELDFTTVHTLADKLNRPNNGESYKVWIDLLRLWLSRLVRGSAAPDRWSEAASGEEALARRLTANVSLDRWVELWEKIGGLAIRAERINLDHKQVVLNAFMALQMTARS